jgi:hypothetical protein
MLPELFSRKLQLLRGKLRPINDNFQLFHLLGFIVVFPALVFTPDEKQIFSNPDNSSDCVSFAGDKTKAFQNG